MSAYKEVDINSVQRRYGVGWTEVCQRDSKAALRAVSLVDFLIDFLSLVRE